jgi:O-acetyl-ADP-ribose deacetylase (regulator of RNase III)
MKMQKSAENYLEVILMLEEPQRKVIMKQTTIIVHQGDITKLKLDAIVNAANPSLLGGGGVDGAIHLAAGREMKEACRALCGCAVGQAKLTAGYNLPASYVIHTVGPIWQGGGKGEAEALSSCYRNSLQLALNNSLATIAFPAISTGAYGYPKEQAAQIAVSAIRCFCARESSLETVYLVAFNAVMAKMYQSILDVAENIV